MDNCNNLADMTPKVFTYSSDDFFKLFISYMEKVRANKYRYNFNNEKTINLMLANNESLIFIIECHWSSLRVYMSCVGLAGVIEHFDILEDEVSCNGFAKFFYTEVHKELTERLNNYYLTKQDKEK